MKTGVSTSCLFPKLTEESLRELLEAGIDTVEIFLNSPGETTPAFATELRRLADSYGARILSVHPCTSEYEGVSFFGRYPRRFDDAAEEYKKLFEVCSILGAGVVPFHGARAYLPVKREIYFERFDRLSEIAAGFSVKLCQENVVNFFSGTIDFIAEMRRQLPGAHMLLDIKQARRSGVCPFQMMEAMGGGLTHIHASDHTDAKDCLPVGDGYFDFAEFVRRLRTNDYSGAMIVELYSTNFQEKGQLVNSIKILNGLVKL